MAERAYAVATMAGWVGWLETERGVRRATLPRERREELAERLGIEPDDGAGTRVGRILVEYYGGQGDRLGEVELDLAGQTDFQRAVREVVRQIPPGGSMTYGEVAAAAGNPKAARAVGRVMATNPVAPFIPCHRVIGRDGLHGYGGGLGLKQALLEQEKQA